MTSRSGRDRDKRSSSRAQTGRSRSISSEKTGPRVATAARGTSQTGGRLAPRARGKRHIVRTVVIAATVLVAVLILAGVGGCAALSASLPDPSTTKARGRDQSTIILDRDGRLLARLFAEQNRSDQPLQKMPAALRQAVIATEDQRFYEHAGVDPIGIARALVTDVVLGKKSQGGSTITQQYIKNAFGTPEKTLKRKLEEALLANKIEKNYTKDKILELYLNTIYFGHGAYGVEAASQVYFGKGVEKLDLAESAMLAGVIKSPGHYSPYLDPAEAKHRRDTVLGQMRAQSYITAEQETAAVAQPVKTTGLKSTAAAAPYFVEWIKERLLEDYGEDRLYRGGLVVRTTLDLKTQAAAEKAIASTLNKKGDPSAALVAIKPGTGEVLAMVGGRDFKTQQFNVAVQGSGRQPGSAFKPFVLATALASGVSPEQTFESGPIKLPVGDKTWSVTGASGGRTGPMRLREATEKSVNSVFAKLITEVGPEKVVSTAVGMGLRAGMKPVPAIALGGTETGVTPLEMATAFATLAANGKHASPYGIVEVRDASGQTLFVAKPETDEALDPAVAYLTTDILKGVITDGTGTGADIGRPSAGKTGTTQENRDAWFVGYTPQLATAVWMGFPEAQTAMSNVHGRQVTGGSFPAEIWSKFMRVALASQAKKDFVKPDGLKEGRVCVETGMAATPYCPRTDSALLLSRTELKTCTKHVAPTEIEVPDLVGMSKKDALALLSKLKFRSSVSEKPSEDVAVGTVTEQTPKAGSAGTTQTVVAITVSSGPGSDQTPVPDFSVPTSGKVGQPVSFDGSPSKDDGKIVKWYWEFGDSAAATTQKAGHTYAAPGTYEVTLRVTDDGGQQASITKKVKIE
jgi:penicillin-binding protein 1A